MASRRILDFFAIANASAAIARKHLLIRSHQLNHFAITTSIGKTLKPRAQSQIPRQREPPPSQHEATGGAERPQDGATGGAETSQLRFELHVNQTPEDAKRPQHTYESTTLSQTADPPLMPEVPDGAVGQGDIPAETLTAGRNGDMFYLRHGRTSSIMSNLPQSKTPRETVGEEPVVAKEGEEAVDDKEIESLGAQVFQSRRARGLFGVKPKLQGLKIDERKAASVDRPAAREGVAVLTSQRKAIAEEVDRVHIKVGEISRAVADEVEKEHLTVDKQKVEELAAEISQDIRKELNDRQQQQPGEQKPFQMTASRVPSSRVGRLLHYGGLAAGLAWGAAGESVRRVANGAGDTATSVMFSEPNVERLVKKLSRMRGAALKLGQMMSFQDKILPAPFLQVLTRVQDSADYMPSSQRDSVLAANLGPNWRELFSEFSEVPMAAASIGQVHSAKLASNGMPVAVKIQYPGVAASISSDLNNLAVLLTASRLLPKGLYLDKTIANARLELGWECDYVREAECAKRFLTILEVEKDVFRVPRIFEEACGPQVLTMELMRGIAVTKIVDTLTQEERDFIGTQILGLCFREVAKYRFMQTDPNWTNFLWNAADRKIELLDFGASREFPEEFIAVYTAVLRAAAAGDRKLIRELSVELGYLTGLESETMVNAHVDSILTLAEPFSRGAPEVYDFCNQTVTDRVKAQIPLMLRERLAPPPEETYSLHRKLSGAFLLCARLGSRIRCRETFVEAVGEM